MRANAELPEGADDTVAAKERDAKRYTKRGKLRGSVYDAEMERLQEQLVLLQYWIQRQGLRVLVIFEGRGSAGKGGVIKRITERTSPRTVRVVALPQPTERERTQWYFQRYVEHLPSAGEIVLFDRSLVQPLERRVGDGLLHRGASTRSSCAPARSSSGCWCGRGSWCSSTGSRSATRSRRAASRPATPSRSSAGSSPTWTSRSTSSTSQYSMAKDTTFQYTDIKQAPWYVVPSDDKKAARLNCISHLLSQFDYDDVAPDEVELPEMREIPYVRPPMHEQTFVPQRF